MKKDPSSVFSSCLWGRGEENEASRRGVGEAGT